MDLSRLLIGTRRVAGLQIGDRRLKVLVFSKTKEIKTISFNEIGLEPGIIQNGWIKNEEKFIQTLKKLFKEAKPHPVKTPYIVLVLPDYEVFTLTFSFPSNLTFNQIEEAIKLDSPSFLPWPFEEVYLDWQVIASDNPDRQEVLVSAIPKKLADSYIEALKKTNLLIINLETPANSLVRSLEIDEALNLVIDLEDTHTLLALVDKKSPRFSQILPFSISDLKNKGGEEKLIAEIKKIIHFWEGKTSLRPQKIYLLGKYKALQDKITQDLKLKVLQINEPHAVVKGAAKRGLISPNEDKDISLLPLGAKESYDIEKLKAFLRSITDLISISFLLILFLFAGFWMLFSELNIDLGQQLNSQISLFPEETQNLEKIASSFNQMVSKMVETQKGMSYFSPVLDEIMAKKPEGVSLTRISYTKEAEPLVLAGISSTREKILEYKSNLENSGKFSKVDLPVKSYEQKENINFTLSLTLKPGVLKR